MAPGVVSPLDGLGIGHAHLNGKKPYFYVIVKQNGYTRYGWDLPIVPFSQLCTTNTVLVLRVQVHSMATKIQISRYHNY
jgi:hypothetical protein